LSLSADPLTQLLTWSAQRVLDRPARRSRAGQTTSRSRQLPILVIVMRALRVQNLD
jgi:hypothetical protein